MTLFIPSKKKVSNLLSDRFIVPPFSVLDTQQEYWIKRRRLWLSMGIRSELGRDSSELKRTTVNGKKSMQMAFTRSGGFNDPNVAAKYGKKALSQTSIFDPVLCELAYRWFSKTGDVVLDPFAGGSVRGIVAGSLQRRYIGIDLSEKQILENELQYNTISDSYAGIYQPEWIVGDSMNILNLVDTHCDLIFTCPPYYNLEVYSTKEEDLSYKNSYTEFLDSYRSIIQKVCSLLKNDCFAVIVVSNFRGNSGEYYNFVGDTISAFKDCGLVFYNDCVIRKSIGTLPLRSGSLFDSSRKIGKAHENFLVFYKGDARNIKLKFGKFEGDLV